MSLSMDIIFIEDLRVDTVIGVFDWEKEFKQPLYFDIEMQTDIRASAINDDIDKTVSYKEVSDRVIELVENTQFELLETLAERLCETILKTFSGVFSITLKVKKPQAVPRANTVGIQITRKRNETT